MIKYSDNVVRSNVFRAVTMKNVVFWDVSPCHSYKNHTVTDPRRHSSRNGYVPYVLLLGGLPLPFQTAGQPMFESVMVYVTCKFPFFSSFQAERLVKVILPQEDASRRTFLLKRYSICQYIQIFHVILKHIKCNVICDSDIKWYIQEASTHI
jgi:hypothetical protein